MYIKGKTNEIQVSQPSLTLNFTQNSDYQSRDCYYFVNKIRAPSLIENVFPESRFKIRISELVFIHDEDQIPYAVSDSFFTDNPVTVKDYVLPMSECIELALYKKESLVDPD